MRQTLSGERSGVRYLIAKTLWLTAGFIVLLALGDVVIVATLALTGVAMTAAWWIRRTAARRTRIGDAALAPVSQLPASARAAAACGPWDRHNAA
ncbi:MULTISPECIES: hypothetical protein [Mycobacterium]|uniref:Uncharacterized protein n=1 Tax=Mycobacterium colombiense TaxID=339268 RepID=A0A329LWP7_9MYCO|nr:MULTISPECIES: hypothetical protein [Mycobacterium]MDM4143074.1 hypothetical protein [Mycobacterium sp. FLAC0960]RAV12239.1 hypothetical protein DQP57_09915 [Mycobacterium colombiense]